MQCEEHTTEAQLASGTDDTTRHEENVAPHALEGSRVVADKRMATAELLPSAGSPTSEKVKSILKISGSASVASAETSRKRSVKFGITDVSGSAACFGMLDDDGKASGVVAEDSRTKIESSGTLRARVEERSYENHLDTSSNTSGPTSPRLGQIGWAAVPPMSLPDNERHKEKQPSKQMEREEADAVDWDTPSVFQGFKEKGDISLLDVSVSESTVSPGSEKSLPVTPEGKGNIERRKEVGESDGSTLQPTVSLKPPKGNVGAPGRTRSSPTFGGASLDNPRTPEGSRSASYKELPADDLPKLFFPTPKPPQDLNDTREEQQDPQHHESYVDKLHKDDSSALTAELLDRLQQQSESDCLLNPEGGVDPQHLLLDNGLIPPVTMKKSVASPADHTNYEHLVHPSIQLFPDLPVPVAPAESESSIIVELMTIEHKCADKATASMPESGNQRQAECPASSTKVMSDEVNAISPIGTKCAFSSSEVGVDTYIASNTDIDMDTVLNAVPLRTGGSARKTVSRKNSSLGLDSKSDVQTPTVKAESEAVKDERQLNAAKPVDVQTVSRATEMWREVLSNDEDYTTQSSSVNWYLPGGFFDGVQTSFNVSGKSKSTRKGAEFKRPSLLPIRGMEIVGPTKPPGENTRRRSAGRKSRSSERRKTGKGQPEVLEVEVVTGTETQGTVNLSTRSRERQTAESLATFSDDGMRTVAHPHEGKVGVRELSAFVAEQLKSKDASLSEECASRLKKKWGVTSRREEGREEEDEEERVRRAKRFERLNLALLKLEVCRKNNSTNGDLAVETPEAENLDCHYEARLQRRIFSPSSTVPTAYTGRSSSPVDPPSSKYWNTSATEVACRKYGSKSRTLFAPPHSPVKSPVEPPVDGLIYTPARAASVHSASWVVDRSPDEDKYSSYFTDGNSRLHELRVHDSLAAKNFARDLSSLTSAVRGSELFSLLS